MIGRIRAAASWLVEEHGASATRYVVVGLTGYLLSLALFAIQLDAGVSPYAAVPAGFVVNTMWNFALNRWWSFGPGGRPLTHELGGFCIVAIATLVTNYAVLFVLHDVAGLPSLASQAAAILLIAPVGYLGQRYWVFADVDDPADGSEKTAGATLAPPTGRRPASSGGTRARDVRS